MIRLRVVFNFINGNRQLSFAAKMAKTFKKLQVTQLTSDFEKAVKIVEQPIPKPEKGQVLVRNLYVGVNATDVNITAGRYFVTSPPPYDIGFESVGVVEESNGTGFKKGDSVMYNGLNAYSEYLLVKEAELIPISEPKPDYLAINIVALTAAIGLDEIGQIQKGDKVLITAAAGGTGQIAVQWAKLKGCYVIGTCSSDEKGEYLKSIGCDFVINYKNQDIDKVLSENYPNGVDVIWETIGGDMTATLFKHLAKKGRMILLGSTSGYTSVGHTQLNIPNLKDILIHGSRKLAGYFVMDYPEKFPNYMTQLISKYKSGEIKARIDMGDKSNNGRFRGLNSISKAVNYLHTRKSYGKVVVQISE